MQCFRLLVTLSMLVALVQSVGPARTSAQSESEPAGYRDLVDEALVELRAEHFAEARALFAEAHQLFPNARTLRGLGIAAFELRAYAESIEHLEQALQAEARPLDARLRAETEALLERAYRFVARLHLILVPAETRVWVDDAPVTIPHGKPLVLEVGEHLLKFGAEGFVGEERSIVVKGREVESWDVTLRPVLVAPSAREAAESIDDGSSGFATPLRDARRSERPLYKNGWLWTGVALGAVAVAAAVVAVVATREGEPRTREPVSTPNTPPGGILSTLGAR